MSLGTMQSYQLHKLFAVKLPNKAIVYFTCSRFFINIGKEKDLQTHNLIGLINEYTKDRNIPVGKIDIMRKFSFFETPSNFESTISAMQE